jgi:hypothetical protein
VERVVDLWLASASAKLSTGIVLDGDYAKQFVSHSTELRLVGISCL